MTDENKQMMNLDQPKPNDIVAEKEYIGTILKLAQDKSIRLWTDELTKDDFYIPLHATIFKAICDMKEQFLFVCERTVKEYMLERNIIKKHSHEEDLVDMVMITSRDNAKDNLPCLSEIASRIKMKSELRHIIATCTEAIQRCYIGDENPSDIASFIKNSI